MKIIKIKNDTVQEFEKYNNFILLYLTTDSNYYLVENGLDYESVDMIELQNGEIIKTFDDIISQVSTSSNRKTIEDIEKLQKELNNSDYQIIKSYEYSMVSKPLPYDINELHKGRQLIRDKINTLQQSIKPIKTWEELSNIVMWNNPTEENII